MHQRVDTAEALNTALDQQNWDIVFAEHSMPHFNGLAALLLLKEKELDIPFIFVSGSIGEDVAAAAMTPGASDYFMKGNLKRLLPTIERELREARMRMEHKESEKMVQR